MAPLSWTVDTRDGRAVVAVRGQLDLAGTVPLRTALLKCLAMQPEALILDLAEMSIADNTSLAVFTAVVRQAEMWPGTPVLFCAPTPRTAALLARGRFGRLRVHGTVAAALRGLETGRVTTSSFADQLLPVSGAARHARDIVTEACSRWGLPHLTGPGSLIASELVTNATVHAGTMMTFRITLRQRYVHIAVHDGSPQEPVLMPPADPWVPGGRGLLLVASMAVRWGCMPSRDGKVVWAVLAARPA
jgi:anti-anti-sigma regulatory factor/anti-sigma regulatory factor (Ser/Thr protein kinase)